MRLEKDILVVDDRSQDDIVRALGLDRERILFAKSLEGGLDILRKNKDLLKGVVLDIRLPKTDAEATYDVDGGLKIYQEIALLNENLSRKIDVVFVTALDSPYVFRFAMEHRVPILPKDMLRGLRRWARKVTA